MTSDEILPDIVERAKLGEEQACQMIFNRYSRPVLGFINNIINNRDLAEEMTQETFVRAFQNLKWLNDDSRLSTWLFGIARNVSRESIRTIVKNRNNIALDEPESLDLRFDGVLPDTSILDNELREKIGDALLMLDEDKRMIFMLKIFHEKSYEEISQITGHSVGKLKTDIHRARIEIRKRLSQYLTATGH